MNPNQNDHPLGQYEGQKTTMSDGSEWVWREERRCWVCTKSSPSSRLSSAEEGGFKPKHPGDMPGFYKG